MTQYNKQEKDVKARSFSGKPGQPTTPQTQAKKTILRDQPVRGGEKDN